MIIVLCIIGYVVVGIIVERAVYILTEVDRGGCVLCGIWWPIILPFSILYIVFYYPIVKPVKYLYSDKFVEIATDATTRRAEKKKRSEKQDGQLSRSQDDGRLSRVS